MTEGEFQRHMNRLIEQFSKGTYSQARVSLIWREVQHESSTWWERTVDRLLGECRQAPLLPEIREALAKERERNYAAEKARHTQEAEVAMQSIYSDEERGVLFKTVIDRVKGNVNDSVWAGFQRGIRRSDR